MVNLDESVITRSFATLQALEKCHANSEKMFRQQIEAGADIEADLFEQKKMLTSMRRVANRLNIEIAKRDSAAVYRSLQIFYGLNALVRPEILASFQLLAGASITPAATAGAGELH